MTMAKYHGCVSAKKITGYAGTRVITSGESVDKVTENVTKEAKNPHYGPHWAVFDMTGTAPKLVDSGAAK
jgi:hypothetical protein